jgi:hypothetical protein
MDNRFILLSAYGVGGVVIFFVDLIQHVETGGFTADGVLPAFGNALIWPWYVIQAVT